MRKKVIRALIALVIAGWPSLASAQVAIPKEGLKFRVDYDARTLAEICTPGAEGSAQELKNLLCAGYIIGVRDAMNYRTDTVRNLAPKAPYARDSFCPTEGTQRGAYIDAFNEYMKSNPEMGEGPAAGVVALAFEWKFPCPKARK